MQLSKALFSPKINNGLAALDDQTSMFSVAARDAVGSSGRIGMEYKRDKHGGRERLLEEALTLVIWGFGVRFIKQVYDALVGGMKKMGIHLPDLDIGLLPRKLGQSPKQGQQMLTADLLKKFRTGIQGDTAQYEHLSQLLEGGKSALQKYQFSSIAKFGLACILPALAIAFAVPTFNQWLTRLLISKEALEKAQQENKTPTQAPVSSGIQTATNTVLSPNSPVKPTGSRLNIGKEASSQGSSAPGQAAPNPASFSQMAHFTASNSHSPNSAVHFGGLGTLMASGSSFFLQNEKTNTLVIDGIISGGRIEKARNRVERAEIIFREATLILFLYFVQGHIQNLIHKAVGKFLNIPTSLGFKDMQFIKKKAEDKNFVHRVQHDAEQIHHKMNARLQNMVAKISPASEKLSKSLPDYEHLMKQPEAKRQALLEVIHEYFIHERDLAKRKTNLLFETAIESSLIPTFKPGADTPGFWAQLKSIGRELNPTSERNLSQNTHLDLTKKINLAGVEELKDKLHELALSGQDQAGRALPEVLNRMMKLRFFSLVTSNVACFAALSVVFPAIQHWISYKMTGKEAFPGIADTEKKTEPLHTPGNAFASPA